jgi:hypothetical protein
MELSGTGSTRERRVHGRPATWEDGMGTIAVHEFIALDGVFEDPSWTFEFGFDPKMGAALAGVMGSCKAILLGRRTYEMFAPAWSTRTAE